MNVSTQLKAETVFFIILYNKRPTLTGACVITKKNNKKNALLRISLSKRTVPKDPFHSQRSHPGDRGMGAF